MDRWSENLSRNAVIKGLLAFHATFFIVFSVNICVALGCYLYPSKVLALIVLPYLTYTNTFGRHELKDGARWLPFSKHFILFKPCREFLRLQFLKTSPKELNDAASKPNAQFIIAIFPHGTSCDFRILMDGMLGEVLPHTHSQIRTLTASILFRIPVVREFGLWTGCIDARRKVAERALDNGRSLMVLPGGEAEQIRTQYGKERVYLSRRKGFIKLAIRKNVPVVPVYVFGSSDAYSTSSFLMGPRMWLQKKFAICIPIAFGFCSSLFCPLPKQTTIVFGKPLLFKVKEMSMPTEKELNDAHSLFCKELIRTFDDAKADLGYGDRELEIM